jgi:hypothetical protein
MEGSAPEHGDLGAADGEGLGLRKAERAEAAE